MEDSAKQYYLLHCGGFISYNFACRKAAGFEGAACSALNKANALQSPIAVGPITAWDRMYLAFIPRILKKTEE